MLNIKFRQFQRQYFVKKDSYKKNFNVPLKAGIRSRLSSQGDADRKDVESCSVHKLFFRLTLAEVVQGCRICRYPADSTLTGTVLRQVSLQF